MADKMRGLLGGKEVGEELEGEQGAVEEAEADDASVDAMRAYMAALKGDDAAAALEAYRALQLAEG